MILINLLPPELRKHSSGINPIVVSIAVGGVANLLLILLIGAIQFWRIPHANNELTARKATLDIKKAEAQKVRDLITKIEEHKERRDKVTMLLAKKVYWAHTLDDFANLLTGKWSIPGFDVRVQDLSIRELVAQSTERRSPGSSKAEAVSFSFKWKWKMVGMQEQYSGDYVQSFLKTIEKSPFWRRNGFNGKPEDNYPGDSPKWDSEINRKIVDGTLEWRRTKLVDLGKQQAQQPTGAAAASTTGN
jgi:hypothetical protein